MTSTFSRGLLSHFSSSELRVKELSCGRWLVSSSLVKISSTRHLVEGCTLHIPATVHPKLKAIFKVVLGLFCYQIKRSSMYRFAGSLQYKSTIYMWKSNIWYNKQRFKSHLAFINGLLHFVQRVKNGFLKTKPVSEASCCAMQRLSTEVGLD